MTYRNRDRKALAKEFNSSRFNHSDDCDCGGNCPECLGIYEDAQRR